MNTTGFVKCAGALAAPAGGSPIATFTGTFDVPLGVVAAEK